MSDITIRLEGGDWRIFQLDDGTWTITDAAGESCGRWSDAESLAVHLAMAISRVRVIGPARSQ